MLWQQLQEQKGVQASIGALCISADSIDTDEGLFSAHASTHGTITNPKI